MSEKSTEWQWGDEKAGVTKEDADDGGDDGEHLTSSSVEKLIKAEPEIVIEIIDNSKR